MIATFSFPHWRDAMPALLHLLRPHERDIDFPVKRLLPTAAVSAVGPFVFFDHMGPATFPAGTTEGDVRPHPHIGLSTFTYLFLGAMSHRDSLGVVQRIEPGAVNWMTAGRGVVHSERIPADIRDSGQPVEGIQMWLAAPADREDDAPGFQHYPAEILPLIEGGGARLRVLVGAFQGVISPVRTEIPTLCVSGELEAQATLALPTEVEELAVYVAAGKLVLAERTLSAGQMAVLDPRMETVARTTQPVRLMLIGGQRLDGKRLIWWNFVATSRKRIEAAKIAWAQERFPLIPGETERIPLPAGSLAD